MFYAVILPGMDVLLAPHDFVEVFQKQKLFACTVLLTFVILFYFYASTMDR